MCGCPGERPRGLLAWAPCDGPEDVIRGLRRHAAVLALLAGAACVAVVATPAHAGPSGSIAGKRSEVQRVALELQRLDASAQRANSQYEAATGRLRRVDAALAVNRQSLGVARVNLAHSQQALARRLVQIYTSQDDQSSLAVILGARSLSDLLARIETANSVSHQDMALIHAVVGFRKQIVQRRTLLRRERAAQRRLVAVRAATRNRVEGQLAAERHLYSSVHAQLDQLVAQQRAQQAAAARKARYAVQAFTPSGFGVGDGSVGGSLPPERFSQTASIAMQYLGTPYVWGGASPAGFDCSGLVMYVYAQVGISLPHYTVAQWDYANAVSVPRNDLQPGDLVFFDGLGHVGIYIGNGEFIHAPHTGAVVSIDSLNGWYGAEYDGARRILG